MMLSRKTESPNKHFDDWASTYDDSIAYTFFFKPIHSEMIKLVTTNLENPAAVLDVGCGTGRLLRSVARQWPQAGVHGIDLSKNMISQARQLLTSGTFQIASAESIPVPDGSMDLALSSMSFHHWEDQVKGLREIVRIVRTGGWFCFADQTMPGWFSRLAHSKSKTIESIRALIEETGFTITDESVLFGRLVVVVLARKDTENTQHYPS
jgi:ubiquinone/menaquinone biosynthesis C-methylase UbiE